MNLIKNRSMFRNALLTGFIATLIMTAGCSGFLSDPGGPGEAPTENPGSGDNLTPADGDDLRTINLPDEGNTTKSGEVDASDPIRENSVYEPVEFRAEAGTVVNVTMQTDGGSPALRLIDPNGEVLDITTQGGPGTAQFTSFTLRETGHYTIEAIAANPETTFEYTLTIERNNRLFAGPQSTWNKTEKYLEFGRDFGRAANTTADNGQFYTTPSERYLRANASDDYLVIGYQWDPANLTFEEMVNLDVALQLTYENAYELYSNDFAENPDSAEDESWVPEVIYFRAETPDGELYRTNFIELRWVQHVLETENTDAYAGRYYSTNRYGPANPYYQSEGGNFSTTDEEFPLGTYANHTYPDGTTHGERYYGNEDNGTEI